MSEEKPRRRLDAYWEAWYPTVVSLVLVTACWRIGFNVSTPNVDKIIDASINLASIIIGLLGALLGILISVKDAKMIDFIFRSVHRDTIYRYIRQSIFAGFLTIGFASVSYIDVGKDARSSPIWSMAFFLWLFCATFLLISSYRIIDILMYLLANKDVSVDRPDSVQMNPDEVDELKRQTARNKS